MKQRINVIRCRLKEVQIDRKMGYGPQSSGLLIPEIAVPAFGWSAGEDENDRRIAILSCSNTVLSVSDHSSSQYPFNRAAYANSKPSIPISLLYCATPFLLREEDSFNFRLTALFSDMCLFFAFAFSQKILAFNQALRQWLIFFLSIVHFALHLGVILLTMSVETNWIYWMVPISRVQDFLSEPLKRACEMLSKALANL